MSLKVTFNRHDELKGQHALFSPSQSAWLRYDEEKVVEKVRNQYRTALGTEIHEFAASQIELGHKIGNAKALSNDIENYIWTKYKFLSSDLTVSDYAMHLVKKVGDLPKEVFDTIKFYVNDGIGYKMIAEQPVVYSDKVFGTADTIIFRNNTLRIHDLKTGANPAHMEQLETYAALFCLEYNIKPIDIQIELRLYQWDGIVVHNPTIEDILPIMDMIRSVNKIAEDVEKEDAE